MTVQEDNSKDEVVKTETDLTKVHEHQVAELDKELLNNKDDDEQQDESSDDKTEANDASDDNSDDDENADDEGQGKDGEGESDDEEVDEPPVAPEKPVVPDKPIELDTDTTKPGEGKIPVKDSDGNTHYFNNLDEVPDDFEPSTYKEFAVAVQKFADKAIVDREKAREAEIEKAKAEQQAEIDSVIKRWDGEQKVMIKSGALPKDPKERETEIGDTYAYISKKTSEGIVIESFAEAHKAMKYDQSLEAKAKEDKKKAEDRRERGSKVMGGGGGTPSKGEKKAPLPPGTNLDAVHARYSGLI